ncbi:hypothetical protein QFZ91_000393 [Paraburkholderia sp. JPY419]
MQGRSHSLSVPRNNYRKDILFQGSRYANFLSHGEAVLALRFDENEPELLNSALDSRGEIFSVTLCQTFHCVFSGSGSDLWSVKTKRFS